MKSGQMHIGILLHDSTQVGGLFHLMRNGISLCIISSYGHKAFLFREGHVKCAVCDEIDLIGRMRDYIAV